MSVDERFVSMLCLKCLGDPEHYKEHDGPPWIPTEADLECVCETRDGELPAECWCERKGEWPGGIAKTVSNETRY